MKAMAPSLERTSCSASGPRLARQFDDDWSSHEVSEGDGVLID